MYQALFDAIMRHLPISARLGRPRRDNSIVTQSLSKTCREKDRQNYLYVHMLDRQKTEVRNELNKIGDVSLSQETHRLTGKSSFRLCECWRGGHRYSDRVQDRVQVPHNPPPFLLTRSNMRQVFSHNSKRTFLLSLDIFFPDILNLKRVNR